MPNNMCYGMLQGMYRMPSHMCSEAVFIRAVSSCVEWPAECLAIDNG